MESKNDIKKQNSIISSRPYTICVDLDGVLAALPRPWRGCEYIGSPVKKNIKRINNEYIKRGIGKTRIIIHTARITSWDETKILTDIYGVVYSWLRKNKVTFDTIWTGPGKPFADEYWDDRAVKIKPTYERKK